MRTYDQVVAALKDVIYRAENIIAVAMIAFLPRTEAAAAWVGIGDDEDVKLTRLKPYLPRRGRARAKLNLMKGLGTYSIAVMSVKTKTDDGVTDYGEIHVGISAYPGTLLKNDTIERFHDALIEAAAKVFPSDEGFVIEDILPCDLMGSRE